MLPLISIWYEKLLLKIDTKNSVSVLAYSTILHRHPIIPKNVLCTVLLINPETIKIHHGLSLQVD